MIDAAECTTISLDIPAVEHYLHIVGSTLNGMLTQEARPAEPDTLAYNVQIAVMEICKNIVQHAYPRKQGHERIHITFQLQAGQIAIELFDTGIIFDPSQVQEPDIAAGRLQGYGLYIAKHLLNEVTYCHHLNGNYWYLVKNLHDTEDA
jgi:serine/threonine-protein kinase RsbW